MATVELVMPKMGESIIEATILKWTKAVGDEIEQEETVLEIATDKVDSEVPAPADGKLLEIRYEEGAVVPVGEVRALIETEAANGAEAPAASGNGQHIETPAVEEPVLEEVPYVPSPETATPQLMAQAEQGRFWLRAAFSPPYLPPNQ